MQSDAPVLVPFHDCIIFVRSLDGAEFSGRLTKVAQTLDSISRTQLLTGGSGLGKRWLPGSVRVRGRAAV